MTLEDYFRKQTVVYVGKVYPAIDHSLRCEIFDGGVRFYIHPANSSGDTLNFEVHGNTLIDDPNVTRGEDV